MHRIPDGGTSRGSSKSLRSTVGIILAIFLEVEKLDIRLFYLFDPTSLLVPVYYINTKLRNDCPHSHYPPSTRTTMFTTIPIITVFAIPRPSNSCGFHWCDRSQSLQKWSPTSQGWYHKNHYTNNTKNQRTECHSTCLWFALYGRGFSRTHGNGRDLAATSYWSLRNVCDNLIVDEMKVVLVIVGIVDFNRREYGWDVLIRSYFAKKILTGLDQPNQSWFTV